MSTCKLLQSKSCCHFLWHLCTRRAYTAVCWYQNRSDAKNCRLVLALLIVDMDCRLEMQASGMWYRHIDITSIYIRSNIPSAVSRESGSHNNKDLVYPRVFNVTNCKKKRQICVEGNSEDRNQYWKSVRIFCTLIFFALTIDSESATQIIPFPLPEGQHKVAAWSAPTWQ